MNGLPESKLVQIAEVLFKWKVAIVLVTLGTAVVALLFSTTSYRASAQILLQVGREHIVDASLPTAGAVTPAVRFEQDEQTTLAAEILTGYSLARDVVAKLGADRIYPARSPESDDEVSAEEKAANRVTKALKVATAGSSTLIDVSFEHEDPEIAALVVNALADGFIERHIAILKDRNQSAFLAEQLELIGRQLNEQERVLAEFKAEHGLTMGSLDEERSRVGAQLALLQIEADSSRFEADATRRKLSHLEDLERENRDLNSGRYNQLPSDVKSEFLLEGVAMQSAAHRHRSISSEVRNLEARLDELDALSGEFERLSMQVAQSRSRHKLHMDEMTRATFSDAMDARGLSSVRVIERAMPPREPISSKLALLVLALVAGLSFGVVWAVVLEFFLGTLDTPSDVQRCLGTVPIATIPEICTE